MKRRLRTLLLFLVAGAIVNVAVAWGCTLLAAHFAKSYRVSEEVSDDDARRLMRTTGFDPEVSPFRTEFGVDRFPGARHIWMMYDHASSRLCYEIRAGLPFETVRGVRQTTFHQTEDTFTLFKVAGTSSTYLPYGLIWSGFAINTVFYAAILAVGWGVFAAPFALRKRRRRKRGLCPTCAYPVGGSAVCTECGRAVDQSKELTA